MSLYARLPLAICCATSVAHLPFRSTLFTLRRPRRSTHWPSATARAACRSRCYTTQLPCHPVPLCTHQIMVHSQYTIKTIFNFHFLHRPFRCGPSPLARYPVFHVSLLERMIGSTAQSRERMSASTNPTPLAPAGPQVPRFGARTLPRRQEHRGPGGRVGWRSRSGFCSHMWMYACRRARARARVAAYDARILLRRARSRASARAQTSF